MNSDFWKGKRVFLTGHTGFKGSWLSLWLRSLGAEVLGYALAPPSQPNLFEVTDVASEITSIYGDINDLENLRKTMSDFDPEIVFHLAAQSLVRQSYDDPIDTYTTNVIGTVNVLESLRSVAAARACVVVTTDKVYENREWAWSYRERDRLGGHDPYSNSKACAELVASSYRDSFFDGHAASIATARAGNVIGGGDWARDRLVPDVITAFIEKEQVVIRNPNAIRPWQDVMEPLHGYLMLAERLWEQDSAYAGSWNFGPNDSDVCSVASLMGKLAAAWGADASWQSDDSSQPHEAQILKLDSSLALSRLGWTPRLGLDESIGRIVEWYKAYAAGDDMKSVTLKQLKAYEEI